VSAAVQPLNVSDEAHAAKAYVDPSDPEGRQLMGATTVIKKAMPAYLVPWAAKLTATYAVDNLASWQGLERQAAIDLLKGTPDRTRDAAGDKGSIVHRAMESYSQGITPDEVYDAAVLPYIQAALAFLTEWQPRFVWVEASVFHPDLGYAGTLDFIAELPGLGLVIGDYKTGKGIYPEVAAQLAAYRYASHAVGPNHERLGIPKVAGGVVVHLRGDGTYELRPVRCAEAEFEVFRHALGIATFKSRTRGIIGPAQPAPVLDVVAAVQSVFPGAELVTTSERRAWIVERVTAIVGATGGAEFLAARWPAGVATLRDSADHTDADIDAIVAACWEVEGLLQLPFPTPDPAATPVAADDPRVAEVGGRLAGLARDLVEWVAREAVDNLGIPRLSSGRCTEPQLAQVVALVEAAEAAQGERAGQVGRLLADLAEVGVDTPERVSAVLLLASGDGSSEGHQLTAGHIDRLALLTEAATTSFLVVADDGWLKPAPNADDLLVRTAGNRRDALNATKRAAKAAGVTPPKSFADVVGDSTLVALALGELASAPASNEARQATHEQGARAA
jgi:hypothetical protein